MRTHHRVAAVLVLLALVGLGTTPLGAAEWQSDTYNVRVEVPGSPYAWEWMRAEGDWQKVGIVRGAQRVLKTLEDGSAADGEMGIVHLIIRDKPEDMDLAAIAEDNDTRKMFLGRFGKKAKWPDVESVDEKLEGDHPAVILRVRDGQAMHPKSGKAKLASASMVITQAKGKMYFWRAYVWHTEEDAEQLKLDLDMLEFGLMIPDTKEEPKPGEPPPPEENEGEPEVERVAEDIDFEDLGLKLTKHKQLVRHPDDEKDTLALKLEHADARSWYSVYLYASLEGQIIDGVQAPPADIRKWITTDWYTNFVNKHPAGDLVTFKWPRSRLPSMLTLPDMSEDGEIVITKAGRKRPMDPSAGDIEKMKIVQKVKKPRTIGKGYKIIEPWRGVLGGNVERRGREVVCRFAWRTKTHAFRLFVVMGGDAKDVYYDAIKSTLESMAFYKKRRR